MKYDTYMKVVNDKPLDWLAIIIGVSLLVGVAVDGGSLADRISMIVGLVALALSLVRLTFILVSEHRRKEAGVVEQKVNQRGLDL